MSRYRCTVEMTVEVEAAGDLEAQELAFALVVRDLTPADFWVERVMPEGAPAKGPPQVWPTFFDDDFL